MTWLPLVAGPSSPEWYDGLPRCIRCGHPAEAHDADDLSCLVNAHDGAEGPECECEGYDDGSDDMLAARK